MGKTKIFLIAGEHSGDLHGAELAFALKSLNPNVDLRGLGGPHMDSAGVKLFIDTSKHTAMGLTEVIGALPDHIKMLGKTVREIKSWKPDVVIPIDYPDFNLRVAARLFETGIPVVYYVSPQIWAWRSGRIKQIKKFVNKMLVIFPFEVDYYKQNGVDALFVGHPLVDRITNSPPNGNLAEEKGIPKNEPLIGILPGSRSSIYRRHWPLAWETAKLILSERPDTHFIVPLAGNLSASVIRESRTNAPANFHFYEGHGGDVIKSSTALLTTSGTATIEAALLGTPMVVFYKISSISYALAKRLVKVPAIAMCNLIAGKKIVEEFVQNEAEPAALSKAVLAILDEHEQNKIKRGLLEVSTQLGGPGASMRAAEEIIRVMNG